MKIEERNDLKFTEEKIPISYIILTLLGLGLGLGPILLYCLLLYLKLWLGAF